MTIVVTTPTGQVGSRVAQTLVRAGVCPRLLARDAGRVAEGLRSQAEVVEVDLEDEEAVVGATAGAEAMYWVAPATGAADPVAGYTRSGEIAARAVVDNAIPRVVFQSSVGAEARQGFGEIDGLGRVEELLDATPASVTHLRCGYFFSNLLMDPDWLRAGRISTTLPLDHRLAWVDPQDIAVTAVGRLLSRAWEGRVVQGVYGPADLSFAEAADIIGAVTGHPVEAVQVSDEDVAGGLRRVGMTEAQVDGIVGMLRGFRGGFVPEVPRDALSTTPTPLQAWATVALAPVLAGRGQPGQ